MKRTSDEAQLTRLFTVYNIPHLVSLSMILKEQIVRKIFTAQGISIRRSWFRLKMNNDHIPFGRDLSSVSETILHFEWST